jgi:(E)-4-hydroxy-3-methylbut-2-enyl-diphosphate synthase
MASKRQIFVGNVAVGGGAEVSVQSMCNTRTSDVEKTCAQIARLAAEGCQIIRVAVPDMEAAEALLPITARSPIPVVADIHFDWRLAVRAAECGAHALRVNPGNIGGRQNVQRVADAARANGVPIRVGVNAGSLEKELLETYGPTPEALCRSALSHLAMLEQAHFYDVAVSIKASDVRTTVEANRLMAQKSDVPLHIGVTEAGTREMGIVKSAAGLGALLLDGVGDTVRVSLTDDPVYEVRAALDILRAIGLRRDGVEVISCPTCGRTRIDLASIAQAVQARVRDIHVPMQVAVMGCVVNGPGEARHADVGMAGGDGAAVLFRHGEIVRTVRGDTDVILEELMKLVRRTADELSASGRG